MIISYIALGSNLDSPENQLKKAITHLHRLEKSHLTKISSFYHNQALTPSQPDYVNAMVEFETTLSATDLLYALQTIEHQQGRIRSETWGPRTLDLDIILYGNEIIYSEELKVPHPGMLERDFVILPLLEIAPQLILPNGEPLEAYRTVTRLTNPSIGFS